jgi:hypothetical protein
MGSSPRNFGAESNFIVTLVYIWILELAGSSKGFKHISNANIETWEKLKMTQI